jgi:hypothetical protein
MRMVVIRLDFVEKKNTCHEGGQFNGTGDGIIQEEIANKHCTTWG